MLFDPSTTYDSVRRIDFLRRMLDDGTGRAVFCRMVPYGARPSANGSEEGRLRGDVTPPDYDFLDPRLNRYHRLLDDAVGPWIDIWRRARPTSSTGLARGGDHGSPGRSGARDRTQGRAARRSPGRATGCCSTSRADDVASLRGRRRGASPPPRPAPPPRRLVLPCSTSATATWPSTRTSCSVRSQRPRRCGDRCWPPRSSVYPGRVRQSAGPGSDGVSRGRDGDAGLVGDHHELGAVAGVQLGEQAAHVGLGRGRAHDQLGGDLGVREALGHQGSTSSSRSVRPSIGACDGRRRVGALGELLDEPAGDPRATGGRRRRRRPGWRRAGRRAGCPSGGSRWPRPAGRRRRTRRGRRW